MWIVVSWSWWWSECNNHGWALWLAVENEWRELFATTPVSLRVFRVFFFIFPSSLFFTITYSHFVQKNSATEIPQSEQLNLIHRRSIFFSELIFFSNVLTDNPLSSMMENALSSFIDHLGIIVLEWVYSLSDANIYVKIALSCCCW